MPGSSPGDGRWHTAASPWRTYRPRKPRAKQQMDYGQGHSSRPGSGEQSTGDSHDGLPVGTLTHSRPVSPLVADCKTKSTNERQLVPDSASKSS